MANRQCLNIIPEANVNTVKLLIEDSDYPDTYNTRNIYRSNNRDYSTALLLLL